LRREGVATGWRSISGASAGSGAGYDAGKPVDEASSTVLQGELSTVLRGEQAMPSAPPSERRLVWTPDLISAQTGVLPEYLVTASEGSMVVAKWRHARSRIVVSDVAHHILLHHVAGQASLSRIEDGKPTGKRSRPGCSTLIPIGGPSEWQIDGECTLIHVYVDPGLLARFSKRRSPELPDVVVAEFVAVEDPWLQGFFRMLTSEIEIYSPSSGHLQLFLTQMRDQLLGHLSSWYSHERQRGRPEHADSRLARALRPALLKRVEDYVEAHLAEEIHVATLARLVFMSEDHFIRAFHAARGQTPYHFLLEKRLEVSARHLKLERRSIREIARSVGIGNPSYFSAKFRRRYGMTPSRYRETSRDRSGTSGVDV
jgi:AraC family transcriptional regulator